MSLLLIFIVYLACVVLLGFSGGVEREPILCCAAFAVAHALLYALVFRKLERHRVLGTSMAIIGVGIALRLCFLSYPVTDDMYRYVWEGRLQLHGDNPYVTAPAASKYAAVDPLFDDISHKDMATVYGPVVMLEIRGLAALCDVASRRVQAFFHAVRDWRAPAAACSPAAVETTGALGRAVCLEPADSTVRCR